ncbi:MAG: GAF domain-containing protein [Acidimicrobiales bacterium]
MAADRLLVVLMLLARSQRENPRGGSLCAVAAEFTELSGAGIVLVSADQNFTSLCTSNHVARELMDLEISLGEGPSVEACAADFVIDEPDLANPGERQWLAYGPSATDAGAQAVFGFPVRIGGIRLGALCLYRGAPGELTATQLSDAYLMASVIGRAVLSMQAGAPSDTLAAELEREATFDFSVHQAAGMVAVQGSMSVGSALVSLRAHAFALNVALSELAQRVVTRQTAFDPTSRSWVKVQETES